jgi:signal transduction protein with GAF and PtsI domain
MGAAMSIDTSDETEHKLAASLVDLDARLSNAPTPDEVAWIVCEFAAIALSLVDLVVYLVNAEGVLAQSAAWGPKRVAEKIIESRIQLSMGQGIVGVCAELRKPLRVADTRYDARYVTDIEVNRSELAVPICYAGQLFGVLDSEHPDADFYSISHERAMLTIAGRAGKRLAELQT